MIQDPPNADDMSEGKLVDQLQWSGSSGFVSDELAAVILRVQGLKDGCRMHDRRLRLATAGFVIETEGESEVQMVMSFARIPEDGCSALGSDKYQPLRDTLHQNLGIYHNVRADALAPFNDPLPGDGHIDKRPDQGQPRQKFTHKGNWAAGLSRREASCSVSFVGFGHAHTDTADVGEKDGNCAIIILIRNGNGGKWRLRSYANNLYLTETCY